MSDVKAMIQQKIKGKKVMVFSKSFCPYCAKAKRALDRLHLSPDEYEIMQIEREKNSAAIQSELRRLTGASTVPRVFVRGKCIGGGDETALLAQSGKLKAMLQDTEDDQTAAVKGQQKVARRN